VRTGGPVKKAVGGPRVKAASKSSGMFCTVGHWECVIRVTVMLMSPSVAQVLAPTCHARCVTEHFTDIQDFLDFNTGPKAGPTPSLDLGIYRISV
jgi:hypothetical protein